MARITTKTNKTIFRVTCFLAFLLSVTDAVASYTQSSFLEQYFSLDKVALILAIATGSTLAMAWILPKLVIKISNYRFSVWLAAIGISMSLALSFTPPAWVALPAFVFRYIALVFLLTSLDVFLEKTSDDRITGKLRTKYLTSINMAWLLSPILMSILIKKTNYGSVYLAGAFILAFLLILLYLNKHLLSPRIKYKVKQGDIREAIKTIVKNKDLRADFSAVLTLNMFFSLAVLYIPIHLNQNLGFGWDTIGILFTVMLLPFILVQYPAGVAADKYIGEKEMMMAGGVIMAAACASIFITTSTSPVVWGAILFLSRVGTALSQSMTAVYFYKKIDVSDVGAINLFRQTEQIGWLAGAILAVIVFQFTDIPGLFLVMSGILLVNVLYLRVLQDTK